MLGYKIVFAHTGVHTARFVVLFGGFNIQVYT